MIRRITLLACAGLILGSAGLLSAGTSFGAARPATARSFTVSTSSTASATSGCGKPTPTGSATAIPGSTSLSPDIDDHVRTVIVHIPIGYGNSKKVPLVLNMHGSGTTALDQELFTGMDQTADQDGFIVAYPQGLIPDGTGFDWNVPDVPLIGGRAVPSGSANDVKFLTDLVGVLAQRYCIDTDRVYATGFSGGARMASQLACDASTVFAAVAPVSGLRHPSPCDPTRDVPILSFHGTADPVDPFNGHGEAYWKYSVPQAAQYWGLQESCAKNPSVTKTNATVQLTKYSECKDGSVVELYAITGEGHEWPGGPVLKKALTRVLGPQTTAIDADSVIWSFFEKYSL